MFFESSGHTFWKGMCVILIFRHPVVDLKGLVIILIIITVACQCNLPITPEPA
jgi:hypothetical protein